VITVEQLTQALELVKEIKDTELLLMRARQAGYFAVEILRPGEYPEAGEIRLAVDEIGDQIVGIIEHRLAKMKERLRALNVQLPQPE
jgi:hypothetical protein